MNVRVIEPLNRSANAGETRTTLAVNTAIEQSQWTLFMPPPSTHPGRETLTIAQVWWGLLRDQRLAVGIS